MSLIQGPAQFVLCSGPGRDLLALDLCGDSMFVREELLVGLDACLTYDNGRLSTADADGVPMVHLRGRGAVVLEIPASFCTLEVALKSKALARSEAVLGWTGRLVSQALAASELPSGLRGCVAFSGEGGLWLNTDRPDSAPR
jgi:uncharacterized protein (AIM24 family)